MASWAQSQPRQFKEYVPEINSEVYAKALTEKNEQYQVGAKKVEQYNSIAGSIPVANNEDQKYVQGIANKITSDLNEKIAQSGDLSDQKLVNSLGVMASTIYKDPHIQTIIKSTSDYKNENSKAADSTKKNQGKDVANQSHYQSQVLPWVNTDKAATPFNAKFLEYTDIAKGGDDIAKSVPEEEKWTTNSGLGTSNQQDLVQQQFKFRSAEKIRQSLEGYYSTNSGAATQVYVEAEYHYKDYDLSTPEGKQALYEEKQAISQQTINQYNQNIASKQQELLALGNKSNPKINEERKKLNEEIEGLQNAAAEKDLDLKIKDHNSIVEASQDPNKRSELVSSLYKESLIQQKISQYAYNDPGKIEISGQTAFEKQLALSKEARDKTEFDQKESDRQEDRKLKYLAKQHEQYGSFIPGMPTKDASTSWARANKVVQDADDDLHKKALGVAYSLMNENGANKSLKRNSDGSISIIKPTMSVGVPGKGLVTMPTNTYIYGGDYTNARGEKEKYIGLIPDLMKAYQDGNYKAENSSITLSDVNRNSIAALSDIAQSQEQKKDLLKSLQDEVYNPADLNRVISDMDAYPTEVWDTQHHNHKVKITGQDLLSFNRYNEMASVNKDASFEDNLAKSGLTEEKYTAIMSNKNADNDMSTFFSKQKDIEEKLNKATENLNLIITPGYQDWTGVKSDEKDPENTTYRRTAKIQTFLTSQKDENGDILPKAAEIAAMLDADPKGEEKNSAFNYTQDADTKEFTLTVMKGGKSKSINVPFATGVNSFGWQPLIGKQTQIEEDLSWSKNHSTCPEGKPVCFNTAKHLGIDGEDDLRYHIIPTYTNQGLVNMLYLYRHNTVTGKDSPTKEKEVDDLNAVGIELENMKRELKQADKNKKS